MSSKFNYPESASRYVDGGARWHVGIDPGVKTGLAVWDKSAKNFTEIGTLGIIAALSRCLQLAGIDGNTIQFHYEDARLRVWKGTKGREVLKGVGSIERDCAIWQSFFQHHKLNYRAVAPRDVKTKMSKKRFQDWTGWTGRTSEHARDAGMIVFGI